MSTLGAGAVRTLQFNQAVNATNTQPTTVTGSQSNNPYANTFSILFPTDQQFSKCEMALNNLFMYYSWFNISAAYGNNTFQYIAPIGGGVTRSVTVPDGFYNIDVINEYLTVVMDANGDYTADSAGTRSYYINLVANPTYYAVALTELVVVVPGGGSNPNGLTPGKTFQLVVPPPVSTNITSFSAYIGFNPGTYPAVSLSTNYAINGQQPPEVSTVTNVNVACDRVINGTLSRYPNVFYTFSPQVDFGQQIVERPFFPVWLRIIDGTTRSISFTFTDQNNNPLPVRDPGVSGVVQIREITDKREK